MKRGENSNATAFCPSVNEQSYRKTLIDFYLSSNCIRSDFHADKKTFIFA